MTLAKHVLPFRRKREGRTNYRKRLALLKSGKPRVVVRRTNKHVLFQAVRYDHDGDRIAVTYDTKLLGKEGLKGSLKSLPAAYLGGVLFAHAAKKAGFTDAIVDLGLQKHVQGGRLSAAIKGLVDGGLAVPAGKETFPAAERLAGKHLADGGANVAATAKKLSVKLPGD